MNPTAPRGVPEPADLAVLVVDDDEINRRLLAASLERSYRVVTAGDGEEALDRVARESIDLVLLDLVMPNVDGFTTLETLRRTYPPEALPVVITTSRDDARDVIQAFRLGANDYVTKPFDPAVVEVRVAAQLRRKLRSLEPRPNLDHLIEPGAILGGRYQLAELIGRGAHGVVYRAHHRELDAPVAVKILREDYLGQDRLLQRFRQEGISASRVEHPNAVQVRDFGVTSRGAPYLVMELLQGESLEGELERFGRLSPRRALALLKPICDVLAEAHLRGIVHRDVKPSNVFLHKSLRGEVVKVLDFGLAAPIREADGALQATVEIELVGTPAYLPPERVQGEPYDGRSDVYSLGVMLYEMLVGQLPFPRTSNVYRMLMAHVKDTPVPPRMLCPELGPEVERVVLQALVKEPSERLTAAELGANFAAAVTKDIANGFTTAAG